MSIRPQKPAPATPAPGKLPITELAEMKARRQPIVMVTAYDAPGRTPRRRGGRRSRARRRLCGDDRARPRLDRAGDDGGDAHPHARGHPRRRASPRHRGHAVRLVPGLGRGRRPQRDPLREGGGRRRGEARGRRGDAHARPGDRRRRHPGDGPYRPHAAVGDDARRLQGSGAYGREGRGAPRRRTRTRGGRLLLARPRSSPCTGCSHASRAS